MLKLTTLTKGKQLEFLLWQSPACRAPRLTQEKNPRLSGTATARVCSHQTLLGNQTISDGQAAPPAAEGFVSDSRSKREIVSFWVPGSCRISLFHTRSTPTIAITVSLIKMKQYLWLSATFPEKNKSHQESGNLGKICQMCLKYLSV